MKYEILVVNLGSGVQHAYNTLTTRLQGLSVDIGLQGDIRTSSIRNFVPRFAPFKSIDTL